MGRKAKLGGAALLVAFLLMAACVQPAPTPVPQEELKVPFVMRVEAPVETAVGGRRAWVLTVDIQNLDTTAVYQLRSLSLVLNGRPVEVYADIDVAPGKVRQVPFQAVPVAVDDLIMVVAGSDYGVYPSNVIPLVVAEPVAPNLPSP